MAMSAAKAGHFLYKTVKELTKRYFSDSVSKSGAELAYFFLFSFFPLLIFANSLIGVLHVEPDEFYSVIRGVIPGDIQKIINDYLIYLGSINNSSLMVTGLALAFYSASKAVSALIHSINRAYRVVERRPFFVQALISVVFTAVLLLSVFLTLLILIFGRSLLTQLGHYITIPIDTVNVWHVLRFVIIAAYLLCVLIMLYIIVPNQRITVRQALPGAFFAMLAWLAASIGFSFYVENMARYSFIYGSIGAMIVLMLWLYLTGIILVMGGELNYIVSMLRSGASIKGTRR